MTAGGEAPFSRRRRPAQQRSRERVERILEAASAIIAERGSDGLKMSDIATQSGMSLGALYQYFPDKSAIVQTLAEYFNAASRACVEGALAEVDSVECLEASFIDLMEQYWRTVQAEPVMRDIWSGMQANKELASAQAEETRVCSALLAAALRRVHPTVGREILERTSLLVWELGEAAVRLGLSIPGDQADALVATYTRMSLRELIDPA